jgi:pilus assembly protein CpaE
MRNPKILVLDRNDELADQVQGVADELRPRPEVVSCTRIAEAGDLLTEEGPFDVLVAGPSLGTRTGLSRLELIHDELPTMSVVLAFARRPDANLREVVRAGAVDLMQLPVDADELRAALERGIELARKAAPPAPVLAATAETPAHTHEAGGPGIVFTIASATGGCGKTFYATNMAAFLQRQTGRSVCIVDIDLQFGEVSTAMRLKPKFTIFDALQRDEDEDAELQAHIDEYLVVHETGVSVLAAPKDPAEADRITPPDVTRIIEALRNRFDYVIVDTPAQLSEVVLAAFDLSELLFLMATLDLPSVRNMGVFMSTLEKLKIPSENIRLILNKAESDVGIDVAQIEKLFPNGFSSVLPYAKEVSRSINLGMPVIVSAPTAEVSRRLKQGLVDLLSPDQRTKVLDEAASSGGSRRFSRLFRRNASASLVSQEIR